jgi:hypothetical protein
MSVTVAVRSYTHSVTYVTDNILKSFKDIIRRSGLDPDKFTNQWGVLHRGIRTWIESEHLERVVLEVYDPRTDSLLGRWDVEISYGWTSAEGEFWVDSDAIRFAILKAGVHPALADYGVKVTRKPGFPAVDGWTSATFRSTAGFVEQRIGTTVEGSGLSGGFSYYRRV